MTVKKAILCFFLGFFAFTTNAAAQENTPPDDSLRERDMGVYLLSKITDHENGEPLQGVLVKSSLESTVTDKNGEFFIRIRENDTLVLNKAEYKETFIDVTQLRGRIELEKIPPYLPLYPNASIAAYYRNLGFSESFNTIVSSGRFNDSFAVEGTYRFMNFLGGLNYENLSARLNRRNNENDLTSFGSHTVSLTGSYILNLSPDILEAAIGLKGFYNNTDVGQSPSLDIDRDPDYLDFGYQQFGLGPELSVNFRPLRYTPFVLSGTIGYFPLINVSQPQEGMLPGNLNGFDYNISARYDIMGIFIKSRFIGRQRMQGGYSSGYSGLSFGVGYGF